MIEDYYRILNLKPGNGLYKISIRYLRSARNLLNSGSTLNKDDFYQLNRAFEVLRKPGIKKYYDIIYKQNNSGTLNLENKTIQKYLEIIQFQVYIGNQKAEKLLNDPDYLDQSRIKQPWLIFLFRFIFFLSPFQPGFGLTPFFVLIFITIGIVTLLRHNGLTDPSLLAPGIAMFILGFIILYFNFRQYITDTMNKENGC